jgi:Cu+-exporting ATPase
MQGYSHPKGDSSHVVPEETAIDPVCGMMVAIEGAEHVAEWEGASHYFCSGRCHKKFVADPKFSYRALILTL